jgi:hypothetical protein
MFKLSSSVQETDPNVSSPRRTFPNAGFVQDSTDRAVSTETPPVGVSQVTGANAHSSAPLPTPVPENYVTVLASALSGALRNGADPRVAALACLRDLIRFEAVMGSIDSATRDALAQALERVRQ